MEDLDRATKKMLANSLMELNAPDFESLLMRKIRRESSKNVILKKLLLSCLIILFLELIVFLMVWFYPPTLGDVGPALYSLPHHILITLVNLGGWFIENQYFILPLVILLIIKRFVESKFKYG